MCQFRTGLFIRAGDCYRPQNADRPVSDLLQWPRAAPTSSRRLEEPLDSGHETDTRWGDRSGWADLPPAGDDATESSDPSIIGRRTVPGYRDVGGRRKSPRPAPP